MRQHYRLAMRRRPVCLHPGRFAPLDGGGVQYMFCGDQPLQRQEPMVVITRTIVRLAAFPRFSQHAAERVGPLGPGETARLILMQPHRQGEGLGLPGLRENRSVGIPRQARGRRETRDAVRRGQDNPPTDRDRRCRAGWRPRPTTCGPETSRCKGAARFPPGTRRSCQETHARRARR